MSTGGVFQLVTNDGKQDKMLMASDLLKQRLIAIEQSREANPAISDPTPTLLDIEKTHILFTNAHFKPFVAIGYEYNKTTASAGSSMIGTKVTFSIPQFGDFFYDMVLYVSLLQPTLTTTAGAVSDQPLMRWCPFTGECLLSSVSFEVNGNPLDSYSSFDYNFHREFSVQPNKMAGYQRCVGQEQSEDGYVDQANWANSGVAPSGINYRFAAKTFSGDQTPTGQKNVTVFKQMLIPLLFWCNRDVRLAVPSVAIPFGQRFINVQLAPAVNLCNLVPRGANAGNFSPASIGGTLNYSNMISNIQLYINNIFVNPEVHDIFIKRIGFSLIRVHKSQVYNATTSSGSVLLQALKWPIESLFVGMRPSVYNSSDPTNAAQYLDQWHTFQQNTLVSRSQTGWQQSQVTVKNAAYNVPKSTFNNSTGNAATQLQLSNGATLSAGVNVFNGLASGDIITIPLTTTNSSIAAPQTIVLNVVQVVADSTVAGYVVFSQQVGNAAVVAALGNSANISVSPTTAAVASVQGSISAPQTVTVRTQQPTLDSLAIQAHGINIYDTFVSQFYNSYLPYNFGGGQIKTPEDIGACLITFCLFPGSYQPSGHMNLSRAREFYLNYTSSVISTNNPGLLIVSGSAINFLLISDGSAILRYST
jgi:hypothetical protein